MYYAVDSDHNRVSAAEAVKGTQFFCTTCGSEVITKTRAEHRIAHFAHKKTRKWMSAPKTRSTAQM